MALRFTLRSARVSPGLAASLRAAVSEAAADGAGDHDGPHTVSLQVRDHFADATPMRTLAVKLLSRAIDFGVGRSAYFSRTEGPSFSDFEGASDARYDGIEIGVGRDATKASVGHRAAAAVVR